MDITPQAQIVYQRPRSLAMTPTSYCPGCTHGVANRLVAEVLDEIQGSDHCPISLELDV